MLQNVFRGRRALVAGLLIAGLVITVQVWARNQGPSQPEAVVVQEQSTDAPLCLEATLVDDMVVGTVTAWGKDGQPRTDVDASVNVFNEAGERVDQIPLELTGRGQFRLIVPVHRLEPRGYLEVHLPGGGHLAEERYVYQVDVDGQPRNWVLSRSDGVKPTSAESTGGPDAFGYSWDDTAVFDWMDTTGGTSISLRDDYWVGPFDIGFQFAFYGRTYREFYVDSNGYIGFDEAQTASHPDNATLKDASRPNNIIAPFWDDLDPSRGGMIRYRTLGSAPDRRLVVTWRDVPLSDSVSDLQSFQVILYEGSNDIKFQYPDTREGVDGDANSATVGIENDDGTIALE